MKYLQNYLQYVANSKSNYVKNFTSFYDFENDENDENEEEDDYEILPKIKVKLFETFKNELRRNEN
jgi:hypothetical protein